VKGEKWSDTRFQISRIELSQKYSRGTIVQIEETIESSIITLFLVPGLFKQKNGSLQGNWQKQYRLRNVQLARSLFIEKGASHTLSLSLPRIDSVPIRGSGKDQEL
jgi:hypothetical protein